ncbi:MAG: hypothetical protein MJY77_08820 [Bacteroidaceae bacterium]|nr:hypothetical protein [Bacteroidaceae bacterium]
MGIFDLFGSRKPREVPAPDENREDLGEGMELVNISLYGYWKPRYLVDKRKNKRIEFMSADECFCTVTQDDIDWNSLASLDDDCIKRARSLDIHFPTIISCFHNGVAEVRWQLNPDGMYYMDEDGFGMSDDEEVEIYGFIDREGKVVSKFRHIHKNWDLLKQMQAEAEAAVRAKGNRK